MRRVRETIVTVRRNKNRVTIKEIDTFNVM